MTFVVPPIQQTDLTAAAISTQVWADKEIIGAYEHQAPVQHDSVPTLNDWVTVMDESGGLEILSVVFNQTSDEELNEDIEWRATVDGEVYTGGADIAESGYRSLQIELPDAGGPTVDDTDLAVVFGGLDARADQPEAGGYFRCHDFKFELRQTSALGTNPQLLCIINWTKLVAV